MTECGIVYNVIPHEFLNYEGILKHALKHKIVEPSDLEKLGYPPCSGEILYYLRSIKLLRFVTDKKKLESILGHEVDLVLNRYLELTEDGLAHLKREPRRQNHRRLITTDSPVL